MASDPKMEYHFFFFFCIFQNLRSFPISFKPKVAIAKFIGKMQKKIWNYEKWVGRLASFPPRRSVKQTPIYSYLYLVRLLHHA